jgi:hypothetical protein
MTTVKPSHSAKMLAAAVVDTFAGALLLAENRRACSSLPGGVKMGMHHSQFLLSPPDQSVLIVNIPSDECRFPHIMPENNGSAPSSYFSGRSGPRPRGNHANGNGYGAIEEKLANMTVKDVRVSQYAK